MLKINYLVNPKLQILQYRNIYSYFWLVIEDVILVQSQVRISIPQRLRDPHARNYRICYQFPYLLWFDEKFWKCVLFPQGQIQGTLHVMFKLKSFIECPGYCYFEFITRFISNLSETKSKWLQNTNWSWNIQTQKFLRHSFIKVARKMLHFMYGL